MAPDKASGPERPLDTRVFFHEEDEILEVDLTDLVLRNGAEVAALYNHLERRAAATRRKWFFLINYLRCRIYPEAWIAFANRGKRFNQLFSLGSARFNTEEETHTEIARRADAESFEANLIANREAAVETLMAMRAEHRRKNPERRPFEVHLIEAFDPRIRFDDSLSLLELDISEFSFVDNDMVRGFFDLVEARIEESGRGRWRCLYNETNSRVYPEAWLTFANRAKKLRAAHFSAVARYAIVDPTHPEDRRADLEILPSREAALAALKREDAAHPDAAA